MERALHVLHIVVGGGYIIVRNVGVGQIALETVPGNVLGDSLAVNHHRRVTAHVKELVVSTHVDATLESTHFPNLTAKSSIF